MVGLPLFLELYLSIFILIVDLLGLFQDFHVLVGHVLIVIVRFAQLLECFTDNIACFLEPWRFFDLFDVVIMFDDCFEPVLNFLEIGMVRIALGNAVTLGLQQRVHDCVGKSVIDVGQVR